jgi:hypothetical protein
MVVTAVTRVRPVVIAMIAAVVVRIRPGVVRVVVVITVVSPLLHADVDRPRGIVVATVVIIWPVGLGQVRPRVTCATGQGGQQRE